MFKWVSYTTGSLCYVVGKIMKEIVNHPLDEFLPVFGLDQQECTYIIKTMEDVESNFQIFSAYSFGFFVLAIFDHFGSIPTTLSAR